MPTRGAQSVAPSSLPRLAPKMLRISRQTEVIVHIDQNADALRSVISAIGTHGVRLLAHSLCSNRWGSALLFVADDSSKACEALEHAGLRYKTDSVLCVEADRRPALAAQLGMQLMHQGIGVLYSYVSWTDAENLFAVFKTTDDERALAALGA